jgi:uncharacterized protein (DUF4415 family)
MSDAMQALMRDLEQGLAEAKAGQAAATHTPQAILARRAGRPPVRQSGSLSAQTKQPVKLRLDPDVLAALRASGDGWQTRINDMLRASLRLAGRLPG